MHKEIQTLCARTALYRRERRSVPLAREFARTALTAWDLGHLTDDVLLCVSELATNALLHGVPPSRGYRLCLSLGEDGLLRVEVHDSGGGEPRVPSSAPYDGGAGDESGRGLLLVSALADAWGVGERVPGKVVWCEFHGCGTGYGRP